MKPKLLIALGAFILVLAGCQGGTTTTGSGQSGQPAKDPSTQAAPPPAPTPVVPESLKNDAYHWYGLANEKPMNVVMLVDGKEMATGTQTVHLTSVADGKAVFDVTRDGTLGDNYGSETLSLESDGIYTIKSTQILSSVHNLELPAKVAPGVTFKNTGMHIKMKGKDGQEQDVSQDETFRVVGPAKVQTPVATQDALLITSSGTMKTSTQNFRMETSMWYVKEKGIVKSVVTIKDMTKPKAAKQVITIQEAK